MVKYFVSLCLKQNRLWNPIHDFKSNFDLKCCFIRLYWIISSVQCTHTGGSAGWPQRPSSPLQLGQFDQHHRDPHHHTHSCTVQQPAARRCRPPRSKRSPPHPGQLHPHCDIRCCQRFGDAPQPAGWSPVRGGGIHRGRRYTIGCAFHQPHYLRQPDLPPAGTARSNLEARRIDRRSSCDHHRWNPDRLSGPPRTATTTARTKASDSAAGHRTSPTTDRSSTTDVQLLRN